MFKQRRSFRSVFEGIVLRKKMKVINQSLESVIRNSYPYAPIGGGTIDDLVEYAKKKEIHWKFGPLLMTLLPPLYPYLPPSPG